MKCTFIIRHIHVVLCCGYIYRGQPFHNQYILYITGYCIAKIFVFLKVEAAYKRRSGSLEMGYTCTCMEGQQTKKNGGKQGQLLLSYQVNNNARITLLIMQKCMFCHCSLLGQVTTFKVQRAKRKRIMFVMGSMLLIFWPFLRE